MPSNIARVRKAADLAAMPKSLSGKDPKLLGVFGGGFVFAFEWSDPRIESDTPNGTLLAGSVEDTFYSVTILL
jgi:hypothetical protein